VRKVSLQLLHFADRWRATSEETAAARLRSSGRIHSLYMTSVCSICCNSVSYVRS
jgi:hypothetical protein